MDVGFMGFGFLALRVQVPSNHVLAQSMYCNDYYPNPSP